MGRSANSRNRVFVRDGEGIRTQAFDPASMKDPSLIIYAPVRWQAGKLVVTNGDQTDTICDFLAEGKSFAEALRTRAFEPDAPNFTPRISLIAETSGRLRFDMAVLKAADASGEHCLRCFYEYEDMPAGEGRFVHTYRCDGDPIPSFEGRAGGGCAVRRSGRADRWAVERPRRPQPRLAVDDGRRSGHRRAGEPYRQPECLRRIHCNGA